LEIRLNGNLPFKFVNAIKPSDMLNRELSAARSATSARSQEMMGGNVECGDSNIPNLREIAKEGEFGEDCGKIGDISNNCRNERMSIGSIRRDEAEKLANRRMPL
jgi:hypothetical protein